VRRLAIENFRGSLNGAVSFGSGHTLLVGRNNVGKSTVCEALRPCPRPGAACASARHRRTRFLLRQVPRRRRKTDRGSHHGVLTHLSEEARNRFYRHLRVWDDEACDFAGPDNPTDKVGVAVLALPVSFIGGYDKDEDGADVRVIQRGEQSRLTIDPSKAFRITCKSAW